MYYRRANAALIVYDITREKSFEEAKDWIKGTYMCEVLMIIDHYSCIVLGQNWRVKWTPNLVSACMCMCMCMRVFSSIVWLLNYAKTCPCHYSNLMYRLFVFDKLNISTRPHVHKHE